MFHLNRKRPAQALLDAQPGLWTQPWLGARGNLLVKINNNSVMNVCLSEADSINSRLVQNVPRLFFEF